MRSPRGVHPTGHAKGMQFHSPGSPRQRRTSGSGSKITHSEGVPQSLGIVRPIQGRGSPGLCTQGVASDCGAIVAPPWAAGCHALGMQDQMQSQKL